MKVNLHEQVALVTGAGRGIGKSIAERLADNGARVIVSRLRGARRARRIQPYDVLNERSRR